MKVFHVFQCLLLAALVLSCKPKVPDKYLQPGEFEDILYDYHLADAMADNGEGGVSERDYNVMLYRQAVLKKYGITQAEFDSSLVYYMRHADRLHKVYENIVARLEEDAMSLGASANDIRRYGDMKSARDTSNLWSGVPAVMLTTFEPYNVMSFEIVADSTYREGDKIIFSFNCDFVYDEGSKDGRAVLAIQFKNDSVASNSVRMSSNSNYSVTVSDFGHKGIKAIRGFIYLDNRENRGHEAGGNPLRLMFVDNIRMVRMRDTSSISEDRVDESNDVNRVVRSDTTKKDAVKGAATESGNSGRDVNTRKQPTNARPLKLSDVRPLHLFNDGNKR